MHQSIETFEQGLHDSHIDEPSQIYMYAALQSRCPMPMAHRT